MTTGRIVFKFDDRPSEEVPFSIEEADYGVLRLYLREAKVLEDLVLSFGTLDLGFRISARVGEGAAFEFREPDVVQRAALLHHLRPFVLDEEPFSFFKVRNIVVRGTEGEFIRDWLKELKRIFSGARLQEQLRIVSGDVVVNSEATVRKWLNAFEYHRDTDKAAELEATFARLPDGMTRPVFFMLLVQKAEAIRCLGHAVQKIVHTIDGREYQGG